MGPREIPQSKKYPQLLARKRKVVHRRDSKWVRMVWEVRNFFELSGKQFLNPLPDAHANYESFDYAYSSEGTFP